MEWLYIDNTNDADDIKQGALITFPSMINRWNVTSLIVSKWENYKVVIVTDHPNEFVEVTADISEQSAWTDKELIPFPLLKYSDLDDINTALQNTEVDIIIFDSARMISIIAPALNSKVTSIFQPKIIVLTTWGETVSQLNIVTTIFPDLRLLTLDIVSDLPIIQWNIVQVQMSNRQLLYYNSIRTHELQDTSHILPYPLTRMVTLYTYPDTIMKETLTHKYVCQMNQTSSPDDISEPDSWIEGSYLSTLSNDGPKLLSLLDGIIAHWPAKQIVTTRFNHRYGVDLITSFLQLTCMGKTNPYDLTEIFHISCTDDYETSINTLHKFNNTKSGILVTNINPYIILKDISIIHISDSYSYQGIQTLLDRLCKRSNISIYSYCALHPSEQSSDDALYQDLLTHIIEADRIYSGLASMGTKLSFDPVQGLIIRY